MGVAHGGVGNSGLIVGKAISRHDELERSDGEVRGVVEVLRPRGTGLKRGDGDGFGGTVAACDKGARQSRA